MQKMVIGGAVDSSVVTISVFLGEGDTVHGIGCRLAIRTLPPCSFLFLQ